MAERNQASNHPIWTQICNDQLIYLLQDATDNIRLAKRQQWSAGYYKILVYAALVLVADRVAINVPDVVSYKMTLGVIAAILIVGGAFGGIAVIWNLQGWMGKFRARIEKAEPRFCDEYKAIVGERSPDYTTKRHAPAIAIMLTGFSA